MKQRTITVIEESIRAIQAVEVEKHAHRGAPGSGDEEPPAFAGTIRLNYGEQTGMTAGKEWKAQYYEFTLFVTERQDGAWDIRAQRPRLKITLETSEFDEQEAKKSAACLARGYMRDMEGDERPFIEELYWCQA